MRSSAGAFNNFATPSLILYSFSLQKERKGEKASLYSLAHNGELMFSLRQLP